MHLSATIWAQNVRPVSEKSATHQRNVAFVTHETVRMPMTFFKRDELRASKSNNWLLAATATLRKQFAITFGTVWLIILAGELQAG